MDKDSAPVFWGIKNGAKKIGRSSSVVARWYHTTKHLKADAYLGGSGSPLFTLENLQQVSDQRREAFDNWTA